VFINLSQARHAPLSLLVATRKVGTDVLRTFENFRSTGAHHLNAHLQHDAGLRDESPLRGDSARRSPEQQAFERQLLRRI